MIQAKTLDPVLHSLVGLSYLEMFSEARIATKYPVVKFSSRVPSMPGTFLKPENRRFFGEGTMFKFGKNAL